MRLNLSGNLGAVREIAMDTARAIGAAFRPRPRRRGRAHVGL